MKKISALILMAVLCLCCLVSCNIFGAHSISYQNDTTKELLMDGYAPKWANPGNTVVLRTGTIMDADLEFYANGVKLTQTHADSDYWEYIFTMPDEDVVITHKMSDGFLVKECVDHIDEDENYICDICSYVMAEHKHTYQNYHDEIGHGWSYTCGCMTPPNFAQHHDGNGDYKCDDCTYQMVAEGNHFIRNQAGAEWLCEITADDIAEIKMISGGGGPLPPISFTHITTSRNKAVISSIFEEYYWLDSKPVSEESTQIPDGGYFVVRFILNNGTVQQLYFINGDFYHDGNGNYFELVRLPVFRDGTNFINHYGFETIKKHCQIHLTDETFVCEIPVSELEFMEVMDHIYLDNMAPTRYIEMNGERLYFIGDCYFYIGNDRSVYYQLVGKNLDEFIDE